MSEATSEVLNNLYWSDLYTKNSSLTCPIKLTILNCKNFFPEQTLYFYFEIGFRSLFFRDMLYATRVGSVLQNAKIPIL